MGKINLGIIELTQASEISSVSGNVDTLSGITIGHTGDTNVHVTSTEKTNLDSLATNIGAISGITSAKVGNWDTAASNSHSHSNKTALDSITGSVGTMAYQDSSGYSSATQVNTALGNKANVSETVTATTSADYVKMVTTGGTEVKITKASFVEAMADILNNADKGANVDKVTVTGTDGKFGSVNLTNLASVLGVLPTGGSDGVSGAYSVRRYVGRGPVKITFGYTGLSIQVYHCNNYSMAYLHILTQTYSGKDSVIPVHTYSENTVYTKWNEGIIIKPIDGRWGMIIDIVAVQQNGYSVNFQDWTDTSSWTKLL